jgi:hypothetical protein
MREKLTDVQGLVTLAETGDPRNLQQIVRGWVTWRVQTDLAPFLSWSNGNFDHYAYPFDGDGKIHGVLGPRWRLMKF